MAFSGGTPTTSYINDNASSLVIGQPVYQTSAGHMDAAVGLDLAHATVIGLVAAMSVASGSSGPVQSTGSLIAATSQWDAATGQSGGLTIGAAYFVDPARAGKLTTAMPTSGGVFATLVGIAASSTELELDIQAPIGPIGTGAVAGVTYDALSGKAVPANEAEADTLLAVCGISSGGFRTILNMQDATSPLVDVNGNSTFAITSDGIPHSSYRNAISGWSRLALGLQNASVDIGFVQQGGNLPDPSTHSFLMMCWVMIASVPTTNQGLMSINNGAFYVGVEATTCRSIVGNSSGQQSRGNIPLPIGVPFLLIWKFDNGNKVTKAYTPSEIIGDFWAGAPGSGTAECDFGVALASGIFAANSYYLWGAMAAGTSAEIVDAKLGLLGTAMGQSYAWYAAPTADASGKYNPLTATQFQALQLAAASNVWPLQETSGIVFQDTIGDCFLVAQSGVTSGHASLVAGRVALATTDGMVSSYADSTDSRLPNAATESVAMLFYTQITAAAHGSSGTLWSWIGGMASGEFCAIYVTTGGLLGIYNEGLGPTGSYNYLDGARHPLLLKYDLTNGATTLYTDKEIIAGPSFAAQDGSVLFLGSTSGSVPAAGQLCDHLEAIGGQAAEMSTAQARAYLNKLGWTVLW